MSGVEFVGVPAAAGQFLEQGFKVLKLLAKIIDQVQHAPDEMRRCQDQLRGLSHLVERTREPDLGLSEDEDIAGILERCEQYTEELQRTLQSLSFQDEDKAHKKAWKAVLGVAREEEIARIRTGLEREKSLLVNHVNLAILERMPSSELQAAPMERVDTNASGLSLADQCNRALFLTDPQDHRSQLVTLKGEIVEGTCEWIEERPEFKTWLQSTSSLLWISGGPGKGKTMLSIYLTRILEEGSRNSSPTQKPRMLAYFFCDNKDNKRNNAMAILRGLYFSLLTQGADMGPLLEAWKVKGNDILAEDNFESLWNLFQQTLEMCDNEVMLLVDGMDECDPKSVGPLLKKLRHLLSTTPAAVKVIILSREYPDTLDSFLHPYTRIRLDPDSKGEVETGIEMYISARVDEIANSPSQQLSEELCKYIKASMIEKSQGTYLWASFAINDLGTRRPSQVESHLDKLPSGLGGIYERMLLQIPPPHHEMARQILTWVAFSQQILNLDLLADALGLQEKFPTATTPAAVTTGATSTRAHEILADEVSHCGHFLSVDSDRRVHLVHQSAKDFLSQRTTTTRGSLPGFGEEESHLFLADQCLNCIERVHQSHRKVLDELKAKIRSDHHADVCDAYLMIPGVLDLLMENSLLSYAITWWHAHARRSGKLMKELMRTHKAFFASKSVVRETWGALVELHRVVRDPLFDPDVSLDEGSTALHMASLLGLCEWIEELLGNSMLLKLGIHTALKRQNAWGWTPLGLATKGRHDEAVEILLRHKANPDESGSGLLWSYHTPLHQAAQYGEYGIVKLLLQHKADVHAVQMAGHYNHESGHGGTVVHCASRERHGEVLELLLEHGGDPNGFSPALASAKKERWSKTPLLEAIDPKYPPRNPSNTMQEIVAILLHHGADPNLEDDNLDCPLHKAVEQNDKAVVELLLDFNADPKAKNVEQMTPLAYAASRGYYGIFMRLLAEDGAAEDLASRNPRTGKRFSHYAAEGGNTMILDEVVAAGGMCIEEADRGGATPMHWAAHGGHLAMVRAIREKYNASPDFCCYKNETPLHRVVEMSSKRERGAIKEWEDTAAYLIQVSQNPQRRDENGDTPLHYAARNGLDNITALLLRQQSKVDPNDRNHRGHTPLHALAGWAPKARAPHPHTKTLDVLLADPRLDLCAKDDAGRTALAAAVSKPAYRSSDRSLVYRLLATMAFDVNETDEAAGQTPMHILMESVQHDEYVLPTHPLTRSAELRDLQGVMDLLLRHGADLSLRDRAGRTPRAIGVERESGLAPDKRILLECLDNVELLRRVC